MARIPEKIAAKINEAREKHLTELDLSGEPYFNEHRENALTEIPPEVFELEQLKALRFDFNEIASVPEDITRLSNLKVLSFEYNKLTHITKSIAELTKLTTFMFSGNKLKTIPSCIFEMRFLEHLALDENQLAEVPDYWDQLPELRELGLSFNNLTFLPESIARLQRLEKLRVGGNPLAELPEWIAHLSLLKSLFLFRCNLVTVPEWIGQLRNLTDLGLADNQLTDLPEWFISLRNLEWLRLNSNKFSEIPEVIFELTKLKGLNFSSIHSWAGDVGLAPSNENTIRRLDADILKLTNLERLDLSDNPLEYPPPEIIGNGELNKEGIERVKNFFRQLEAQGMDHLYEAKLLILGEGGAGKTTLAKKILDAGYELCEEDTTKGIDVLRWNFNMENGQPFHVNIWDFGGQEIYHATHQFFLTKRSLYALVADTRKEDTDFFYWLNVVEMLSDGSPVLVVKNEKQDRHREINERQLRGQFASFKETLATNLATNRGLDSVKDEIRHYITHLPIVGAPLPKTWVKVREQLEQEPRSYISLDEYLAICQQNDFTQRKDALQLSGYLHDLGVCLHFQDDPLLMKTVILKPKWGTDGVYKVLDNPNVIRNLGRFTRDDLGDIWRDPEYADMQNELLQLMINFKLCYRIPDSPYHIAPQLLTENQPCIEWDDTDNLLLRYEYEFMPKGILTRFIVEMHRHIVDNNCVWRSGVVPEKDATRAEVIEYYGRRRIEVKVAGQHKKELLTIVMYKLDEIHATYRHLKYSKLIPCNCPACKDNPDPHFYAFEVLQKSLEAKNYQIQCQRSFQMVTVWRLIDDVIDQAKLAEAEGRAFPGKDRGDSYPAGLGRQVQELNIFGPVAQVNVRQNEEEEEMNEQPELVKINSAWANGLFYLFAFVVVAVTLGILAANVPFYTLPIIVVAAILIVPIIGAFQLRQDNRLGEKSFMELIGMVIKQLPLLGKLWRTK